MNGTQPTESQKPPPATIVSANGLSSDSLASKKRKKEVLKPIITVEGGTPQAQTPPPAYVYDIPFSLP